MQKRTRRLLFAGCVLLAAALLALLWLRSPSPADPRGYIPLQRIPAAPFTDGIGDFATSEGLWDFRLLQKYRIHLSSVRASLIDGAEEDDLTRWDNAAIYDFLRRIASGKPAALREMSFGYGCEGEGCMYAHLMELRWPASDGSFALQEDHRRCTDTCRGSDILSCAAPQGNVQRSTLVDGSRRWTFSFPVTYGVCRFVYLPGLDAEMDAAMERAMAQLQKQDLLCFG